MRKILVVCVLVGVAALALLMTSQHAEATDIWVPTDYGSIQDAVDNATAGDTIIVIDGIYYENVDVNKTLTIRSENGSANCIVNASSSSDHVFEVTANYVNISGFTVENATVIDKAGIFLDGVRYCNISNNNATNNIIGIYLRDSSNNHITGNTASNNNKDGIRLDSSSNNNIIGNTANNNDYGIDLRYSSNNNITGNTASSNNVWGIYLFSSIYFPSSNNNNIIGNNATHNKAGIYLYSETGMHPVGNNNIVTGNNANNNNDYGIILYNSNNNNITGNNASNNHYRGIHLAYSDNINIIGNTAHNNNDTGISLYRSRYNTITGNTASNNNWSGIYLYSSSNNNTITGNTASNNECGIYLNSSSNNTITGNTASHNNIYGIDLDYSNNNNITGNTANNNYHGIDLWCSNNTTIASNTALNNNNTGIYLRNRCNNNTITSNIVSNNHNGIIMTGASNGIIAGNTAHNNNHHGIYLGYSSNNTITGNTAHNNHYGIYLGYSNDNIIYNNYFNNNNNAFDDGNNTWNITKTPGTNIIGGPSLGGNYWSNYMGVDIDSDGLGDTQLPYTNSGGIQNGGDWHPLVSRLRRPKPRLPDPNVLIYFIGPHERSEGYWVIAPETLICFNMDAANRAGIVEIFYQVDSGFFMRYTECFTLPLGQHRISYYGVDSHGASSNMAHVDITVVDTRAPVTTCTVSPAVPERANGWYRSDVTLGLTAVDEVSDIAVTYYKVDDDYWKDYTGIIMLAEDGEHTFYYYSVDTAGNKEEAKSTTLRIDTANPVVNFERPTHGYLYVMGKEILPLKHTVIIGKAMITATAYDETSGIEKVEFYMDDEVKEMVTSDPFEWLLDERIAGVHTIKAVAYDNAGNIATVEQDVWIFNI